MVSITSEGHQIGEYRQYRLDFGDVRVHVVRNCGWCRKLGKDGFIIGETLFVAGQWVTQKILREALKDVRERRTGKLRIFWKLLDKLI